MRNPKFKEIKPNYRKNVLEVTLRDGKKIKSYSLPFAVFRDVKISSRNRFTSITIDRELGDQAVSFVLEDGSKGDFPADLVLYYCDPTYHWSPLNQLKSALKDEISTSRLSVRVIADALELLRPRWCACSKKTRPPNRSSSSFGWQNWLAIRSSFPSRRREQPRIARFQGLVVPDGSYFIR